jgi:hypothetical protein
MRRQPLSEQLRELGMSDADIAAIKAVELQKEAEKQAIRDANKKLMNSLRMPSSPVVWSSAFETNRRRH